MIAIAAGMSSDETIRFVTARIVSGPDRQHEHPLRSQPIHQLLGRHGANAKPDHVRLYFGGSRFQPAHRSQPGRQRLGVGVVLGQPGTVVAQRKQRAGGNYPGLPHPAAEHLPEPPGTFDKRFWSRQSGADRRSQSLGEANAHGVEVARRNPAPECPPPRMHSTTGRRPNAVATHAAWLWRPPPGSARWARSCLRRDCACFPGTPAGCAGNAGRRGEARPQRRRR